MLYPIDPTTRYADLGFQNQAGYLATGILSTDKGPLVVDPGPASTLGRLEEALREAGHRLEDVVAILLTHIHLDHAGGSGVLATRYPRLRVFVHPRGVRHLIDPERLIASATRLYGDDMDRLWGPIVPIAADQVHPLSDGEELTIGGRTIEVHHTPGHAQHQIAYYDRVSGTAFVGDAAGERFSGTSIALPVTPPPDIDVGLMLASTATIRSLHPKRLFLTHFGPFEDVARHLDQHDAWLQGWAERVAEEAAEGRRSDEEYAADFARDALEQYRQALGSPDTLQVHPGTLESSWYGLARWHRRRICS